MEIIELWRQKEGGKCLEVHFPLEYCPRSSVTLFTYNGAPLESQSPGVGNPGDFATHVNELIHVLVVG